MNKPIMPQEIEKIFKEINGIIVFAWFPVKLYTGKAGYFRNGYAWLRNVLKCRRIGFNSYFHINIEGG